MRLFDERTKYVVIGEHWHNHVIYENSTFDNEKDAIEYAKANLEETKETRGYYVVQIKTVGMAKRQDPPIVYKSFNITP